MQGEMKEWSVRCRVKDLLCKEAKAVVNGSKESPWGSGEVQDMGKWGRAGEKKALQSCILNKQKSRWANYVHFFSNRNEKGFGVEPQVKENQKGKLRKKIMKVASSLL